ncbi:MAG: hypothetical protein HQM08_09760 [Candidatus Riflebacteria bacterium]|nr:hypothetical protein [Candidatus Riflebacteria bacterium]
MPQIPDPAPPVKTGYFEVHNTLNGLPSNEILSILATEGRVLVGSADKGIMFFDGSSWIAYNPDTTPAFPARTVSSIIKIDDNKFWAGTPEGIIQITGIGGDYKFEKISKQENVSQKIKFLMKNGEDVWACTDQVVAKCENGVLQPVGVSEDLRPIGICSGIAWNDADFVWWK